MSKKFRSKCFHITLYINFPYSDILLVFHIFYLFSFGIVLFELGTGTTCLRQSQRAPLSARRNREQRTKGFTRCESWPSFVAPDQPLMHLGQLCASPKAKGRPKMIKVYISYGSWYCIFTWFSIYTLVFQSNREWMQWLCKC